MHARSNPRFALSLAVLLLVAHLGCSDDSASAAAIDAGRSTDGSAKVARDSAPPIADLLDPKACGPGVYPCGPYGTKVGDVIENLVFKEAYVDPDFLCKSGAEMKIDSSRARPLSLGDFHRGSKRCPDKKKKVLWVFVAAGWCHACHNEIVAIAPLYAKGQMDKRLEILNVVFQTRTSSPATAAFGKLWLEENKASFPLAMDPAWSTRKYFPVNATPLNMLIDLETMKITYAVNGYSLQAIGQQIQKQLTK